MFGEDETDETSNVKLLILILIFIVFIAFIASNLESILKKIKLDRFSYLNIIYLLILYIPCLFLDALRFLNKELKIAKNETILFLIILLVLCTLYFIYPIIYKNFAYKNSTLLLNKPKNLNYITELGHTKDLKKYKGSNNPFKKTYRKKKLYSKKTLEIKKELDIINREITELCWDLSANNIPYTFNIHDCPNNNSDTFDVDISCNKLLNLEDPLYSIMNVNYYNESNVEYKEMKCKMYNLYNKKHRLDSSYNEFLKKDLDDDKENDGDKDRLYNNSLNMTPELDDEENIKVVDKVNNNYSISFWLYIEPTQENVNNYWTNIINFGEKVKISYNIIGANQNVIEFKILNHNNEYEVIHVHGNIKSQKWNNFVLIYNDYIMDIFLNTKLVSSKENIKITNKNNKIIVGENNGITGSICNLFYHYGSMNISKIKENYKILINKNPPII